MPELPEVEVLVRHLGPLLLNRAIKRVEVRRPKVLGRTSVRALTGAIRGRTFVGLRRRGKYLLFEVRKGMRGPPTTLVGHLGMTGRMYLLPSNASPPKHASVVLHLGSHIFVFEDTRYFGRLTLDTRSVQRLGPEPLDTTFTPAVLARVLKNSRQTVKVKLLDQAALAGVGNIYASEALFRAGISPRQTCRTLTSPQIDRLWSALREVLEQAIQGGSTVPLDYAGTAKQDRLFYFGRAAGAPDFYEERLRVYDRAGRPCPNCGVLIKRLVQAGRSTYFCPKCQRR